VKVTEHTTAKSITKPRIEKPEVKVDIIDTSETISACVVDEKIILPKTLQPKILIGKHPLIKLMVPKNIEPKKKNDEAIPKREMSIFAILGLALALGLIFSIYYLIFYLGPHFIIPPPTFLYVVVIHALIFSIIGLIQTDDGKSKKYKGFLIALLGFIISLILLFLLLTVFQPQNP
jgi:hypothetical protein